MALTKRIVQGIATLLLAGLTACSGATKPPATPLLDVTHDNGNAIVSGLTIYDNGSLALKLTNANRMRSIPVSDPRFVRIREIIVAATTQHDFSEAMRVAYPIGSGERIRLECANVLLVMRPQDASANVRELLIKVDVLGHDVFGRAYTPLLR